MKGREHFGLAVSRRGNMVGGSELTNRVGAGVSVVEPDQITGVEVDHSISWSRSSLIVRVESVPPRRCLRWARNTRVNLGLAKKGLAGRRCRNDPGHEAATFGDIDLSRGRLPDPLPGVFMKFADSDRFHVSHCVTLKDTKQGRENLTEA